MRRLTLLGIFCLSCLTACGSVRPRYSAVDEGLGLRRVVLYRNGVGYFERQGEVAGDVLRLRVRKDQVNDLLKSLTVVDENGQAVSVSMPLDPQAWANVALATLAPGNGSLAQVLDSMRGHDVVLTTPVRSLRGRIVMVERTVNEPDPEMPPGGRFSSPSTPDLRDYKVTVLSGSRMDVVRLSKVRSVALRDGDLAMQLHRSLDASAGEGMFEQVNVEVRLVGERNHNLNVSYVVGAPMWKPTYRVVLGDGGQALLQAWAVVDNVSGEDWRDVDMSLTSGAPIAFAYDLHTPREVPRTDLTESGVHKRARVALGETSLAPEEPEPEPEMSMGYDEDEEMDDWGGEGERYAEEKSASGPMDAAKKSKPKRARKPAPAPPPGSLGTRGTGRGGGGVASGYGDMAAQSESAPALDFESLKRSTMANARASRVTGLTRMDLGERVTVPDGTSTMVALLNETVKAEEAFLYRPGGSGQGYELNPYRVVRFTNTTDYVLEPGPISVYSGGSFVGEGLSEAVGASSSVTIPFSVEPGVVVQTKQESAGSEMELTRIVRGVLEVEIFYQSKTTYDVRGPKGDKAWKVLVRHRRAGSNYELAERPEGTEDLENAYLIPVVVDSGKTSASVTVVEQTPSTTRIDIFGHQAEKLLEEALKAGNLDAAARAKLEPIVQARREIGKIDTEVAGLRRQQAELDARAARTRENLEAIKKDNRATKLRAQLNKRLDEFTKEGDKIGRRIVELESKRLEKTIKLQDMLEDFDLKVPRKNAKKGEK